MDESFLRACLCLDRAEGGRMDEIGELRRDVALRGGWDEVMGRNESDWGGATPPRPKIRC